MTWSASQGRVGCGGIPESAGDLFQAFGERKGSDRTGLGLGLSIARKVVRAHGGDIHVRNVPGHGCTFVVVVPLAARDSEDQVAATERLTTTVEREATAKPPN